MKKLLIPLAAIILLLIAIFWVSVTFKPAPPGTAVRVFKPNDLAEFTYTLPAESDTAGDVVTLHEGKFTDKNHDIIIQNLMGIGDVDNDAERDYIVILKDTPAGTSTAVYYLTGVITVNDDKASLPALPLGSGVVPHSLIIGDDKKITFEYYPSPGNRNVQIRTFSVNDEKLREEK